MAFNLARYTSPFSNPWAVVGETLMLPALGIALGIWLSPLDPLWTSASFPWLWFAPLLLALRYGPFPGLAATGIILVAWLTFQTYGWVSGEFPKLHFLGGLIMVMLCGEFSSLWVARARRAETTQVYLDRRLEHLTQHYYLLRLSHDRLEQDLIGRPMAMRDALGILRRLATDSETAPSDNLPGAEDLLRLLAQYCQLETAALYRIRDGRPHSEPVATLGSATPLADSDPLIVRALEDGRLWHVRNVLDAPGAPLRYLIAAPLSTVDGERLGLLVVEQMPFFALNEETLRTLNLLVGYYTDGLATRRLAREVRSDQPDCPAELGAEIERLRHVARDAGLASSLVALEFTGASRDTDLADQIERQKRALDLSWRITREDRAVLVTLMPLAGQLAVDGYFARIGQWVQQQTGRPLDDHGIFGHVVTIEDRPAAEMLAELLRISHAERDTGHQRTAA